jgi:hypothetical protein
MGFSKTLSSAVLMAATLACGSAFAGPQAMATAPSGPNSHRQNGGSPEPLKGNLQLNPTVMHNASLHPTMLGTTLQNLQQDFNKLATDAKAYELGLVAMPKIASSCSTKSFSVQDQMAAGCTNNETVGQCMDKLLKYCIKTYYGPLGTPASYKNKAQLTASDARALSQRLLQYADQAEKNGASW